MDSLDNLNVDLLKFGNNDRSFHFDLDDSFFDLLDESEIKRGNLESNLILSRKTDDAFNLKISILGFIFIPCDRCLEDMKLEININQVINIRLADIQEEESDEEIIVSEKKGILNLSWLIYEYICLQIPLSHVHPKGECDEEMLKYLDTNFVEEVNYNEEDKGESAYSENTEIKDIDPRWSKLKSLIK